MKAEWLKHTEESMKRRLQTNDASTKEFLKTRKIRESQHSTQTSATTEIAQQKSKFDPLTEKFRDKRIAEAKQIDFSSFASVNIQKNPLTKQSQLKFTFSQSEHEDNQPERVGKLKMIKKAQSETQLEGDTVKKGRGRPKKVVPVEQNSEGFSEQSEVQIDTCSNTTNGEEHFAQTKVVRKRGRPRKVVLPTDDTVQLTAQEESCEDVELIEGT